MPAAKWGAPGRFAPQTTDFKGISKQETAILYHLMPFQSLCCTAMLRRGLRGMVTQAHRRAYENDGVVHLPGAFRQQVSELREAFRETMEKPGASGTLHSEMGFCSAYGR